VLGGLRRDVGRLSDAVVASVEDTVNADVGGSVGEGVEEMSESQNMSGELARAIPSPSTNGSGMMVDDGI
jgi:hypothetical protein